MALYYYVTCDYVSLIMCRKNKVGLVIGSGEMINLAPATLEDTIGEYMRSSLKLDQCDFTSGLHEAKFYFQGDINAHKVDLRSHYKTSF